MVSAVQVADVAGWLQKSKDAGQSTVLFLGARVGGLFRSKTLYDAPVKYFSSRVLNNLPHIERFDECCRILLEEDISKSEISEHLVKSLKDLPITSADIFLAELVKEGLFDTIISTNIDDLLTQAFEAVGMTEDYNFQVFVPIHNSIEDIEPPQQRQAYRLIKVFGDLKSGEYNNVRNDFYFETQEILKIHLESTLGKNVLMLGYDPFWDRAVNTIFPLKGQEIWYVNEGNEKPLLRLLWDHRRGKHLVGCKGSYDYFIRELHQHLASNPNQDAAMQRPWTSTIQKKSQNGSPPLNADGDKRPSKEQPVCPPQRTPPTQQRKNVLIACSQNDERHLKRLRIHLAWFEHVQVNVWDETKIPQGTNRLGELQKALNHTSVAILLISADFLASDFITENILPLLLQAEKEGGTTILPVIVGPCGFKDTPLRVFKPFNDSSVPLNIIGNARREKVWADLAQAVAHK